ncbi:MAG: hypothetical protein JWQ24_1543 [Tardiphaga sp.]|nr:hypothetical protein [Tardiphaga sp.]
MPLYFFDVTDDGAVNHSDPLGTDMSKADLAEEAVAMIVSIASDRLPDGMTRVFAVSVRDDQNTVVFRASLSLAASWQ